MRGLSLEGRRAVMAHAVAVLFYLLSIWNHELTMPAVLGAVLVYRTRVPWRAALKRFAADFTAVLLTVVFITTGPSNAQASQPLGDTVRHALDIALQALIALAASMFPWLPPGAAVIVAPVLLVLVGFTVQRARRVRHLDRSVREWLLIAGGGLLAMAISYTIFAPSADAPGIEPLALGPGQRTNLLPSIGVTVFVYAIYRVGGMLVLRGRRGAPTAAAIAATVLVGSGYVYRLEEQRLAWDRSAAIQRDVLRRVQRAVPHPPERTTVFPGGYPPFSAPDIASFAYYDDLNWAIKALYDDGTISGWPIVGPGTPTSETRFLCGKTEIQADNAELIGPSYREHIPFPVPYGRALFVDLKSGRVIRPRDPAECLRAVAATPAGAVESQSPTWPRPGWWGS